MNELELSKHYLNLDKDEFLVFDIESLANLLKYHSDLYYNSQEPVISDYEYDILFKKLQYLEEKFDIKQWQTQKVWAEVSNKSSFKKVKHSRPMISLDNTFSNEDLFDFDQRVRKNIDDESVKNIEYMIEFKFDWLWVELIYENWELIQAITRWDWVEGEDVTNNILTIKNIPKKINYKDKIEIRGEVVMPISSFEELNKIALKEWKKVFSNPRNAASWSLRLLDSSITAWRNLKYFAYDLWNFEEFRIKENISSYSDVIYDLEKLWFEISSYFKKNKDIKEVIKNIEEIGDIKKTLDFDIDGLVIKVNDINLWQQIGFTAHHPRFAIAYKFPAEILTTKVLSVDFQVGRTWTITPVANLQPVYIGWVTVKRATLHNFEEMQNLELKIWDNVFIKRAWEVIPKIIWVTKQTRTWNETDIILPNICPSCWNNLKKDADKVRFYCDNFDSCPEQVKQKLINSVSKQALNIDWIAQEQIDLFLELWLINDLSDIYLLPNKKDFLLWLDGYKQKSVENIITSINNWKNQDIVSFIVALNIFWIWKQSAKELAKIIKTNNDLLEFNFSIEDLLKLKDFWEQLAKNVYEFFNNPNNKILISKLLNHINLSFLEIVEWWVFSDLKVCITWSFDWYSRDELKDILEKNWWSFSSSVSKNTNYLLAWEKAWSKLKKALELWVEIISLDDFLQKIKS